MAKREDVSCSILALTTVTLRTPLTVGSRTACGYYALLEAQPM